MLREIICGVIIVYLILTLCMIISWRCIKKGLGEKSIIAMERTIFVFFMCGLIYLFPILAIYILPFIIKL